MAPFGRTSDNRIIAFPSPGYFLPISAVHGLYSKPPQWRGEPDMFDVAVIGGGIGGMATAARLQAHGLRTIVFEAHGQPGGCAGFFRRKGFAFDVGATTLVDFEPGGVGGELLSDIGMAPVDGEALPGYVAWLPDRIVTLHRDPSAWADERLRTLGDTPAHRTFWNWMDQLAA